MTTKDLFADNGSNGQAIEAISESLPELDVVPSLTCGTIEYVGAKS